MISYRMQHKRNRERVSKLINRELKTAEEIHTHTDGTLVVCENKRYHALLHQRTDALKACGHADWRRCWICQKYDDPANLMIYKVGKYWTDAAKHLKCSREYHWKWKANKYSGRSRRIVT